MLAKRTVRELSVFAASERICAATAISTIDLRRTAVSTWNRVGCLFVLVCRSMVNNRLELLLLADQHIGKAEQRIARQQGIVKALSRDGHGEAAATAQQLLDILINGLALMRMHGAISVIPPSRDKGTANRARSLSSQCGLAPPGRATVG